jgi:hypothetical protein
MVVITRMHGRLEQKHMITTTRKITRTSERIVIRLFLMNLNLLRFNIPDLCMYYINLYYNMIF